VEGYGSEFFADIFKTGAGAWVDSQREPMRAAQPVPATQQGPAGESQATSYADVLRNPIVIGIAVVAAIALLAILVKK